MGNLLFNVLLVDDEPLARRDMRYLLKMHPAFVVKWEADSIANARQVLEKHTPHVIFLDIQLRGGTGFELISFIDETTDVVFVTAFDIYAIRAFEVNALDYLSKPVTAKRLDATVNRLRKKRGASTVSAPLRNEKLNERDKILLHSTTGRVFVDISQVCSITSVGGNYISIRTASQAEHCVRGTVKEWESRLPTGQFLRIHRNALVKSSQIASLKKTGPRKYTIALKNCPNVYPISRKLVSFTRTLLSWPDRKTAK